MVVGSEGKWSKALKAAFIQASLAGPVKMPFATRFPGREPACAAALNRGSTMTVEARRAAVNQAGAGAVFGGVTLPGPRRPHPA